MSTNNTGTLGILCHIFPSELLYDCQDHNHDHRHEEKDDKPGHVPDQDQPLFAEGGEELKCHRADPFRLAAGRRSPGS